MTAQGQAGDQSARRALPVLVTFLLSLVLAMTGVARAAVPTHLVSGMPTSDATPMRACDPAMLTTLHRVEIPAPPEGWSGTPQAVSVFNVFGGEVMVGLGDRQVCGRMHDARTRDSRFRTGVGLVVVPERGSHDPVQVGWHPPVKPHWIPTVRLGGPSPVQQEDTLRLMVRAACLAIALALAFSALMGFVGARDRSFLAHVAMCLTLLLWQATLNGLGGYPQPWLPVDGRETQWQVAFTGFGFAAVSYGAWQQAGTVGRSPRLRRLSRWMIRLFIGVGVLVPLLPPSALASAWWLVDRLFALGALAVTVAACLSVWRGDRRAFAAIAAIVPLLLLFVPQVAGTRPVVEYRVEIVQLALTWFLIVMAYTLTNRYGRLREQRDAMRQLADTDALTGLPNRRAGLARLDDCFERARAEGLPLSLGFVDIDRFKQINDMHGHEAGDRVLAAVGATLAGSVRRREDVIRMGGEEFLVLLPGVDAAGAHMRLEAMRHRIAGTGPLLGIPGLVITASIGLATLADDDAAPAALLHRADGAMYRAKRGGRDRVEGHTDTAGDPRPALQD